MGLGHLVVASRLCLQRDTSETVAVTRSDFDDALRFAPDGSSPVRRRLFAEDSMGLVPGDRVVLVSPPQSALFDKFQIISATGGLTTTTFDRGNSESPPDLIIWRKHTNLTMQCGILMPSFRALVFGLALVFCLWGWGEY
jgi:hypothetical protein